MSTPTIVSSKNSSSTEISSVSGLITVTMDSAGFSFGMGVCLFGEQKRTAGTSQTSQATRVDVPISVSSGSSSSSAVSSVSVFLLGGTRVDVTIGCSASLLMEYCSIVVVGSLYSGKKPWTNL